MERRKVAGEIQTLADDPSGQEDHDLESDDEGIVDRDLSLNEIVDLHHERNRQNVAAFASRL